MAKTDKNNHLDSIHMEEMETKKLADRYQVPYLDLTSISLDRELIQSFPVDFLYRSNFIPLKKNKTTVEIAISDPSDIEAIDSIESFMGIKVKVFAASKRSIHEALRKGETALQVLKDATEGFVMQVVDKEGREDEDVISEAQKAIKEVRQTIYIQTFI